ncbi:MAG: hypothetical protein A4E57_00321 [Syntrophorhabdaceae bacterium PtaU1.Bin034]|jgi:hypothetical protein|nr:MAG: hypothetical protein A4E57_00321 [Syntrophorhabdaceae bacterium PtaU1.Bin034]
MKHYIGLPVLAGMVILVAATVPVAPCPSSHAAETLARNPFTVPRNIVGAIQMLHLKGVICTDRYSGIILQVGEDENPKVFRVGNRISLDLEDVVYEFTVTAIKEKSAVFTGRDGKAYEVLIQ